MSFLETRRFGFWDIGVLLICLGFILVKIPFLDLPYFWDEAWVYAPAVFDLYEHGLSLSPDSIDPYLSRGHPILFHFLAVCWMKIFGTSFVAVHSYTLFLSVCVIFATYALGKQLHSKSAGFWAAGFLAVQPIFLEQSGFLLPEIQLALFTLLTILFYLKRAVIPFIISGTCLLLTKETGILTIGVIGLVELIQFIVDRNFSWKRIKLLFSTAAPIGLAFIYFLVQYFQFGWFTFPEHMGMFLTEMKPWLKKIDLAIRVIFFEQQRVLLVGSLFASIGLGWTRGPWTARASAIIIGLALITVHGLTSWLPDWFFHWVFPLSLVAFGLAMMKPLFKERTANHLFYPIVMMLSMVMILFTSGHFFINRYFIFLFPLLMLSVSVGLHASLKDKAWARNLLLIMLGFMTYHHTNRIEPKGRWWNNLRYKECITVTQRTVKYLHDHANPEDVCITTSYALAEVLKTPAAGYVTDENKFSCSTASLAESDYILEPSFEVLVDIKPKELPDYEKVWGTVDGNARIVVYKRKEN